MGLLIDSGTFFGDGSRQRADSNHAVRDDLDLGQLLLSEQYKRFLAEPDSGMPSHRRTTRNDKHERLLDWNPGANFERGHRN